MLLANFNLANMCAPARDPYYAREFACLVELILAIKLKNSPIRQIKIPAKVSSYTVGHINTVFARSDATLN